jgi:hypothetical protein
MVDSHRKGCRIGAPVLQRLVERLSRLQWFRRCRTMAQATGTDRSPANSRVCPIRSRSIPSPVGEDRQQVAREDQKPTRWEGFDGPGSLRPEILFNARGTTHAIDHSCCP